MILVPLEFKEMCTRFQLASLSYHGSPEAMIASVLKRSGDQRKKVIKEFLSDLLSGKYDNEEISAIWNSAGSDFLFQSHEDLFLFLGMIQERT